MDLEKYNEIANANLKAEMKSQLEALDPAQKDNLQGLLACATIPEAPKTVTFARDTINDIQTFPQFMTWHLEENAVELRPVFDMRTEIMKDGVLTKVDSVTVSFI